MASPKTDISNIPIATKNTPLTNNTKEIEPKNINARRITEYFKTTKMNTSPKSSTPTQNILTDHQLSPSKTRTLTNETPKILKTQIEQKKNIQTKTKIYQNLMQEA